MSDETTPKLPSFSHSTKPVCTSVHSYNKVGTGRDSIDKGGRCNGLSVPTPPSRPSPDHDPVGTLAFDPSAPAGKRFGVADDNELALARLDRLIARIEKSIADYDRRMDEMYRPLGSRMAGS